MRPNVLLFAVTATALVTPDRVKKQQISLLETEDRTTEQSAIQDWWNGLPNPAALFSPIEDRITKSIQRSTLDNFIAYVGLSYQEDEDHPHPPHGGHGRHGRHGDHGDPDKTIYELIKESKHTTKFAKLVEEHDEIKQLLQDTKHNYTLFVPTDRAFERIPHHRHGKHGGGDDDDDDDDDKHGHKPSKEFLLSLLKYHITPGLYPLRLVRSSNTLPTELHPSALKSTTSSSSSSSNHPQRIRVATAPILHFTRLNFHARLGPGDFAAKNGLIHAVDSLLLPPPSQTSIVRLLPRPFSTLALALETTGLGDELDDAGKTPRAGGGTLFAPTNRAWARLGPRVNAFLFSEKGRGYLKALVKYHVVVNETLYSDAYYRGGDGKGETTTTTTKGGEYWHVDLASLLDGKPISVDVKRRFGFVSIVVNGFTRVVVRDGVADDGVIQVVGKVLIPPHKHRGGPGAEAEDEEEMSVEDLKSRLEPYMEVVTGEQDRMGDL